MSGGSLRAPPRRRRRVDGVGRPTLAFRAASEPHEVERDLAQAEAAAPGRHEEREREVREVGDALVERVRRARDGLGHDGRVVVAVRPPVGPVAVEPDVERVVDGLDAGVVRREERRHGPRVARPDAVRPQPRRQQVDEHEGQRRQDDGPVPVELALELLRGRVLAVDAPRLGEGVPLGERHERVVHDVAEERRLGQGGHEVRAGARRQRQQVRERVDGVLGVEDPALGRGLGRREPGFSHVPDERALQLPERRRALAAATHRLSMGFARDRVVRDCNAMTAQAYCQRVHDELGTSLLTRSCNGLIKARGAWLPTVAAVRASLDVRWMRRAGSSYLATSFINSLIRKSTQGFGCKQASGHD